jgi:hypothetical protein
MKQIEFYGDMIDVVELENGQPGVAMRRLVDNLGLEWSGQQKKLQDPIFNCVHMYTTGSDNKQYEMLVMPVKSIPAYLFSINPNKVREDLREKLARYRLECVDVLYNYWARGYAVNPRSTTEGILEDYVQGLGAVNTNFLSNLLDSQTETPEHLNVMEQVVKHILIEALDAEDVDIQVNTVRRKTGWSYMTPVELTVIQTVESEIGLYFAKNSMPAGADAVMDMAKQVGRKVTRRLRQAMFTAEHFSEKFEERIADLIGMK